MAMLETRSNSKRELETKRGLEAMIAFVSDPCFGECEERYIYLSEFNVKTLDSVTYALASRQVKKSIA